MLLVEVGFVDGLVLLMVFVVMFCLVVEVIVVDLVKVGIMV